MAPKANWLWPLAHLGLILPLALLIWDLTQNQLTANPIEAATLRTGKTALVLLVLCLFCSPAHDLVEFRPLLRLRRILGLYAFFYAFIHLTIFVGVDYGLDPDLIKEALFEKRYALAGLFSFLILALLALTSTGAWRNRAGWTWLHRAIYLSAAVDVVHYFWGVKADKGPPLQFATLVIFLLVLRLPLARQVMRRWRRAES